MTGMILVGSDPAIVNPYVQYHDVEQGTEAWRKLRCGLVTASGMKNTLVHRSVEFAEAGGANLYVADRAAERITGYVEEGYVNSDMERGRCDEIVALSIYEEKIHRWRAVGFVTNTRYGFTIGASPDALVGEVGMVECKSRMPKHQVQTVLSDRVPAEHMPQIQGGLLVTEREWCDYISYCAGMALFCKRVYLDPEWKAKILLATANAEAQIRAIVDVYRARTTDWIQTERAIAI